MPNDPRTYAFRVTSSLAGGVIETEEREIKLELPGVPLIEVGISRNNQTEPWLLTAWCGGFNLESEAQAAGSRVKTALVLAGILLGVGIDAGNDQIIGPGFRRTDGQPDERLQPEVHGLQVVPDIEHLLFGSIRFGRPVTRISPADFQKRVAESYAFGKPLTKKQILAAQLYNQSHFHSSDAARFIVLISAVESLADRNPRSPAAVQLIERMIQMVKASTNPEESESLNSGLSNLKNESIGSTCRALVKRLCGDAPANTFRLMYEIRSTLLHTGEPPAGTDFDVEVRKLDTLVRRLLVRYLSS
jgi:hypothetical protein